MQRSDIEKSRKRTAKKRDKEIIVNDKSQSFWETSKAPSILKIQGKERKKKTGAEIRVSNEALLFVRNIWRPHSTSSDPLYLSRL